MSVSTDPASPPPSLVLGIDAGGTFTDSVLLDLSTGQVRASAKAPTTHYDLLQGVERSLQALLEEYGSLPALEMVSLSTTLATNALAENKGARVGALIMTPTGKPDPRLTWQPQRTLQAQMGIGGQERRPLSRDEALAAIDALLEQGVEAFGVSGYAAVRNPLHENQVRELVRERCNLPIICGHELATGLNYLHHTNTALLNGRLLPVIASLLDSAAEALRRLGLTAPLMVVKGDGSLLSEERARLRPVETVLSGPAASVAGARYLTGEDEALVIDLGGTTTDVALLEEGLVRVSERGANVGGWQTSVAAADLQTAALGGDSEVWFRHSPQLHLGPRRVLPLAFLVDQHPEAADQLATLHRHALEETYCSAALTFYVAGRPPENAVLSPSEQALLRALQDGVLSRSRLTARLGCSSPVLLDTENLESLGYLMRSTLTTTDVLHARGEFAAWSVEAAKRGLELFAELHGSDAHQLGDAVLELMIERLCLEVLRRDLGDEANASGDHLVGRLLDSALHSQSLGPLEFSLRYHRPLLAVGAPAAQFFPEVARRLKAQVILPPYAEVANAVGAVAGNVVCRESALIRPDAGEWVLHWREGRQRYSELDVARQEAERILRETVHAQALSAGTTHPSVAVKAEDRGAHAADGQLLLLEIRLEATAVGRPKFTRS